MVITKPSGGPAQGSGGAADGVDAAAGGSAGKGRLRLSDEDRALLTTWARSPSLPARVVRRSNLILRLAQGSIRQVAADLPAARDTVRRWARRFAAHGPDALLHDAPGRGRKPALEPAARQMLSESSGPSAGATGRALARALGVSASTISRWRRRG